MYDKKAYQKEWNRRNRDYVNAMRRGGPGAVHNLVAKLRITPDEARALIERRNRGCLICRILNIKRSGRFVADHDHINGEVRGILCDFHNVMVGYIEKTSDVEKKVVLAYLAVAATGPLNADPYDLRDCWVGQ